MSKNARKMWTKEKIKMFIKGQTKYLLKMLKRSEAKQKI